MLCYVMADMTTIQFSEIYIIYPYVKMIQINGIYIRQNAINT